MVSSLMAFIMACICETIILYTYYPIEAAVASGSHVSRSLLHSCPFHFSLLVHTRIYQETNTGLLLIPSFFLFL